MGFLKEYWGTQSNEFVEGFLAGLDWMSDLDSGTPLHVLAQEAVNELSAEPELYSQTIEDYAEEYKKKEDSSA